MSLSLSHTHTTQFIVYLYFISNFRVKGDREMSFMKRIAEGEEGQKEAYHFHLREHFVACALTTRDLV